MFQLQEIGLYQRHRRYKSKRLSKNGFSQKHAKAFSKQQSTKH